MTTRLEPEGDGKVSRSYSLASAPLRLLSHSFHSTANTHASASNSNAVPPSTTVPVTQQQHYAEHQYPTLSTDSLYPYHCSQHNDHSSSSANAIYSTPESTLPVASVDISKDPEQTPVFSSSLPPILPPSSTTDTVLSPADQHLAWADLHYHHHDEDQQNTSDKWNTQHIANDTQSALSSIDPLSSIPSSLRKAVKFQSAALMSSAMAASDISAQALSTSLFGIAQVDGRGRLERLLMPYDIRYSIFGHLSLQDVYNCQLACKLLYAATSDQFIWKRLALNVIQGEFYFDIPKTLPPNIPNWKFFCKRHLLRQKNWRRGQVQDVISLDDNYQKLTTLQIMAPYVLTGCDDGRVHLWNINTKTLLHRFQIHGEITWVEHLQDYKIVAGLGYDIDKLRSEIRLFSTETGQQIGLYEEDFWDLAICAINDTYLVASDGEGRYSTWNWKTGAKVSQFKVEDETSITEALYFVQNTILELHYDGLIRLFSIHGECYGRFTLDSILPNHQVSFCWLHNDFSMVVWERSNTMAHIRLPLLQAKSSSSTSGNSVNAVNLERHISQEEWDNQGAEVYWRHQLTHTCNFAAMGGGRFQLLYVQIFENLKDQVPIRVHSLRHSRSAAEIGATPAPPSPNPNGGATTTMSASAHPMDNTGKGMIHVEEEGCTGDELQHGEYVTAHSLNPELEKIIQGLRPSRIDCDPEYIVVGLVQGGVRLLQFAPVDDDLFERADTRV